MVSSFLGGNAHHFSEIRLAQDLAGLFRVICLVFTEDKHLWMIINRESFLGKLVVDR